MDEFPGRWPSYPGKHSWTGNSEIERNAHPSKDAFADKFSTRKTLDPNGNSSTAASEVEHNNFFKQDYGEDPPILTSKYLLREEEPEDYLNEDEPEEYDFDELIENQIDPQTSESNTNYWSEGEITRQGREHWLQLSRTWELQKSPNLLLKQLLISHKDDWELRKKVAMARTRRMPIVLMQMMIRNEEQIKPEGSQLLALLPDDTTWDLTMKVMGHSQWELDHYLKILTMETDQKRLALFLSHDKPKPLWLFNFILRARSYIPKTKGLVGMMNYLEGRLRDLEQDLAAGTSKSSETIQSKSIRREMSLVNFARAITLLTDHCLKSDARLMVNVGEITASYIRLLQLSSRDPQVVYHLSCLIFNYGLDLFQPQTSQTRLHEEIPSAYHWEAQRILLDTSDSLPKPLVLNKEGFRAIRVVVAGLRKDQADKHSVSLHSETWPPYLRPGDGMDEMMELEERWSRTVRAGVMMQGSGFPKEEVDEVLDILQGLAMDGTPTIQQRVAGWRFQDMSAWAASIRATRNAQEAWIQFQYPSQHPSQQDRAPGIQEYTALFEKIFARDTDPSFGSLPGDNLLSYPTQEEPNLAEFEKARLTPPSVDELYKMMQRDGVKPRGRCLALLVHNAESLHTAHRYLRIDGTFSREQYECLRAKEPDLRTLRSIPPWLFAAYINVCVRESLNTSKNVSRAIRLAALYSANRITFRTEPIWVIILKNLGQHRKSLRMSLEEQLSMVSRFLLQFRASELHISASTFYQLTRCIQKILRRECNRLSRKIEVNSTRTLDEMVILYDNDAKETRQIRSQVEAAGFLSTTGSLEPHADELSQQSPLFLAGLASFHIKELFNIMVEKELETGALLKDNQVSAVDEMLLRRDAIQAMQVHNYVLSLAYMGDFQEMAKVVKWAMQEWSQPDVMGELQDMDEMLPEANLFEALCAFRAFAEPMLPQEELISVLETFNSSQMGWAWPDDEMVEAYVHGDSEESSHDGLRQVLSWTQRQQLRRQWT